MTDVLYGFDPATVVTDAAGNASAGRAATVYSAFVGGSPFTTTKAVVSATLTAGAASGGIVTSDTKGRSGFFAVDYYDTLYLDFGDGTRWPVNPTKDSQATAAQVAAAVAGKVDSGTLVLDARKQAGITGDGTADDAPGLNAALAVAKTLGIPLYARGTFRINSTVNISSDADLWGATFNYYGAGVAVSVAPTIATVPLNYLNLRLPKIVNSAKVAPGWVAGSVGLRMSNLSACEVWVKQIINFEVGLDMTSDTTGNVYNNVFLGALDNNKINCWIRPTNGGWVNSNTFYGGRHSHNTSEGYPLTGTKHIYMTRDSTSVLGTVPNMNVWLNNSIETAYGLTEYGIDITSGSYNVFQNPRNEARGTAPYDAVWVRWGAEATKNVIRDGYNLKADLHQVYAGGVGNYIDSASLVEHASSSGLTQPFRRYENSSSSSGPVMGIYGAGTIANPTYDPAIDWCMLISAFALSGKAKADVFPRVHLDFANGRTYYSNGTAAPARYLGNFGPSSLAVGGASLLWATHNTYDLGSATQAPRDAYAARYLRVGGQYIRDNAGVLEKSTDGTTWVKIGTGATAASTPPQYDLFTANGTWTKPAGATLVRVAVVGGGGGGASGRRGLAGTVRCGGGGGGGGGFSSLIFDPADLASTVTVFVGAAGAGGAAVTADSTSGNPGALGGTSQFGTLAAAGAGSTAAAGGTATLGTGGTGGLSQLTGGAGGAASTTGLVGVNSSSAVGAAGGASGGGISAANAASNGGNGLPSKAVNVGGTSAAGVVDTTPPVAGLAAPKGAPGSGGGGGASSITTAAQAGAAGGGYGGGGGGGGASLDAAGTGAGGASGAGGSGTSGCVLVITTF